MVSDARPVTAPTLVRSAFTLWIAIVVSEVVSTVLGLFGPPGRTRLFDAGDDVGLTAVVIVFAVVVLGLTVLFAVKMRAGRNWARIVLAVLTVLSLLSLPPLFDPFPGAILLVIRILDAASTVAAVVATVLVFLGPARPWFRRPA